MLLMLLMGNDEHDEGDEYEDDDEYDKESGAYEEDDEDNDGADVGDNEMSMLSMMFNADK